jgi:hypothetical protein
MDLTDVKLPKLTQKELETKDQPCDCDSKDKWPYGLRLNFENEQFKQIPSLDKYEVGDKVIIIAEAKVISKRKSENQDNVSNGLEMQIEKIACSLKPTKKPEEMNIKEYTKMRSGY